MRSPAAAGCGPWSCWVTVMSAHAYTSQFWTLVLCSSLLADALLSGWMWSPAALAVALLIFCLQQVEGGNSLAPALRAECGRSWMTLTAVALLRRWISRLGGYRFRLLPHDPKVCGNKSEKHVHSLYSSSVKGEYNKVPYRARDGFNQFGENLTKNLNTQNQLQSRHFFLCCVHNRPRTYLGTTMMQTDTQKKYLLKRGTSIPAICVGVNLIRSLLERPGSGLRDDPSNPQRGNRTHNVQP